VAYDRVKYVPTVKRVSDELWDEIRLILPLEKPNNTVGRPAVSFRQFIHDFIFNPDSRTDPFRARINLLREQLRLVLHL
jgi:hypothetical protein